VAADGGAPARAIRAARRRWRVASLIALLFLAAHLPFLAPTLGDVDSFNFALGVRRYDIAAHRPHPPGYPIYIALGKVSTAAFDLLRPPAPASAATPRREAGAATAPRAGADRNAAPALALWSALFGALTAFPLLVLFRAFRADEPGEGGLGDQSTVGPLEVAAVVLTLACPLFWFSAIRPMSDVPGLALALVAQALFATAFSLQRRARQRRAPATDQRTTVDLVVGSGRLIVAGAFLAGLGIGLRSQTAWLALPLLLVVLLDRAGTAAAAALLGGTVTCACGLAVWAVPMLVVTGGPAAYLTALGAQAGEDFSGVDMLWTHPGVRRLAEGLLDTLASPWASIPLAVVVLVAAAVGAVAMMRRSPAGLVALTAAWLPYGMFHLLFQETFTTRYALPLVPPVAYLATRGVIVLGRRLFVPGIAALVVACVLIAAPAVSVYARAGSPAIRAIADLRDVADSRHIRPVVVMHRRIASEMRRAFLWEDEVDPFERQVLPSPRGHEWLEVAQYFQQGGELPLWFLAEPRRTDLALIDPRSQRLIRAYRWGFAAHELVGGVRPDVLDWYEVSEPGWILGRGWSLTPEAAGIALADGVSPERTPIVASVRRRSQSAVLMVGGRNLGGGHDPAAAVQISLESRPIDRATVRPSPGFFLRMLTLPAGALAGPDRYARLEVSAGRADGQGAPPPVAIEQFDLQDADQVVFGFDAGWHEAEYRPTTGLQWRWSSASSSVRVHSAGRNLVLHLAGESPLRYFSTPPTVTIRAGAARIGTLRPTSDFSVSMPVAASLVDAAGGLLTIDTDETFVPDERSHNGDRRRLGLRIYGLRVEPAAGQGR